MGITSALLRAALAPVIAVAGSLVVEPRESVVEARPLWRHTILGEILHAHL